MRTAAELIDLFVSVVSCEACGSQDSVLLRDKEFNLPQPGWVGPNYWETRILLIGQNPGASPPRFHEVDRHYAELLMDLVATRSQASYDTLIQFIRSIIPNWPVHGNYFPLAEASLTIDDIAFINLVRCRTKDNSAPSSSMQASCSRLHLRRWIEALQPNSIVCIGKWSYDWIPSDIKELYAGRLAYINRQRSLNAEQRQLNRELVVKFVKTAIGNCGVPFQSLRRSTTMSEEQAQQSHRDDWEFKPCYKSGSFSHTEIRLNGEPFAHCSRKSTNIFPRFTRSVDTRKTLRDANFSEKYNGGDGAYRFFAVDLDVFCKLFNIPIPGDYTQE